MKHIGALLTIGATLGLAGAAQAQPRHHHHARAVDYCAALARTPVASGAQTITVVNQANVKPANLCHVELAIQRQALQLRAAWGTPPITFGPGGWNVYLRTGHQLHGLHDNTPPTATVVSPYESTVTNGTPYAQIWTQGSTYRIWAPVLSHEIMEMLVDPYGDLYDTGGYLVEVCDPLYGAEHTIRGVPVARFEPPSFFGLRSARS